MRLSMGCFSIQPLSSALPLLELRYPSTSPTSCDMLLSSLDRTKNEGAHATERCRSQGRGSTKAQRRRRGACATCSDSSSRCAHSTVAPATITKTCGRCGSVSPANCVDSAQLAVARVKAPLHHFDALMVGGGSFGSHSDRYNCTSGVVEWHGALLAARI